MWSSPSRPPIRETRGAAASRDPAPAFQLDAVPLAVIEADRLDQREARQRPGQAGREVLPAGKQHKGRVVVMRSGCPLSLQAGVTIS